MEAGVKTNAHPPKQPARRNDDPEGGNESLQTAEEEPADIERDVPDTENEPIERDGGLDKPDPPIFEE